MKVQIPTAQEVSKGLWEFSDPAAAQVPAHHQSIGIEVAAHWQLTKHSVPAGVRIQRHELLHQHLGCLLVLTLAKQVRNNW